MSDRDETGAIVDKETRSEPGEGNGEDSLYYCRRCGVPITSDRERIEVDGGHEHTFVNPAGYIYRVTCFRNAFGCLIVGEPTNEFTWFAAYSWAYASCSACGIHLGWAYFKGGRRSFFALLPDELRRAEWFNPGSG